MSLYPFTPAHTAPQTVQLTDDTRNRTPRPYKRTPPPTRAQAYAEYTYMMLISEPATTLLEPL